MNESRPQAAPENIAHTDRTGFIVAATDADLGQLVDRAGRVERAVLDLGALRAHLDRRSEFVTAVLGRLDAHGPSMLVRDRAAILDEITEEALDLAAWAVAGLYTPSTPTEAADLRGLIGSAARAWNDVERVRHGRARAPRIVG